MKILMKGKVETVSLDRVKSAHFECEPETVQQQSLKRNRKRRIQRLLRSFAGPKRTKIDPVALSLRSPTGRELNRKRIHIHSLQRLKFVRVWPSLHSI